LQIRDVARISGSRHTSAIAGIFQHLRFIVLSWYCFWLKGDNDESMVGILLVLQLIYSNTSISIC